VGLRGGDERAQGTVELLLASHSGCIDPREAGAGWMSEAVTARPLYELVRDNLETL
jgi:hypothetical protein